MGRLEEKRPAKSRPVPYGFVATRPVGFPELAPAAGCRLYRLVRIFSVLIGAAGGVGWHGRRVAVGAYPGAFEAMYIRYRWGVSNAT